MDTIATTVFAQSLSNFTCKLWMMRGGTLLILGQRSRSTLALCLYDLVDTIATTVFAQSLSNFTCTFTMMRGGTLLILVHGVIDQGQLCPPARGCHALRCLVYLYIEGYISKLKSGRIQDGANQFQISKRRK